MTNDKKGKETAGEKTATHDVKAANAKQSAARSEKNTGSEKTPLDTGKKLFVAGGGFMGSGIVQTAAAKGFEVTLYDISEMNLIKAEEGLRNNFDREVKKGRMSKEEADACCRRINFTKRLRDCRDADLIVEAIIENEKVKGELFAMIDNFAKEDALIASNTSSISITKLASNVEDPSRFLGMHFFSPVPRMRLLELVKGLRTSCETIEKARELGQLMGKDCILAVDEPGFIVNRMLLPMLNEACVLVNGGVGTIEEIDKGAKWGLNHPMGPLELVDMIGLDIELAVMEVLQDITGDQKYRPNILLRKMVDAGFVGRKAGKGFYIYNEDGTKTVNTAIQQGL